MSKSDSEHSQGGESEMQLKINGVEHEFAGDPATPLLWYLRDELGLTGTKFGCGIGTCGACTVHLDGVAVRSCMTQVGRLAATAKVVTIEGVGATEAGK